MVARMITIISKSKIKPHNCNTAPSLNTSENADLLKRINNNNCGSITGNPRIAIKAALCCALAAMALINVNTRLMLVPPSNTMPTNFILSVTGLVKNIKNNNKLTILITSMSIILKSNLEIMNSPGDVIE